MFVGYVVVTVLAAVMTGFSGAATALRAPFVTEALRQDGVPESWLPWLAAAKLAGAAGLLVGFAVPAIGGLAAAGLVLYFVGALVTVVRARVYQHLASPMVFLVPAAGSLVLLAMH
jgi:hypothetical protein